MITLPRQIVPAENVFQNLTMLKLNCILICFNYEPFNVMPLGKRQEKQCNNNKHQQQHFHPDWVAVIVELSSELLWLQTELAEPISRKLQSKRTIRFSCDTEKERVAQQRKDPNGDETNPKGGCLPHVVFVLRGNVNGTQKEEEKWER